uniref:Uncharacterized protein n=1 Tax=Helianthus annuus TaxID=4232 RepID=A0A251UL60_HELAN
MKLNPSKCHFGVKAGKFLGYMVTQRGIEASPEQIKALVNIKSPANAKDANRQDSSSEQVHIKILRKM